MNIGKIYTTSLYGNIEVLDKNKTGGYLVKFINTGSVRSAGLSAIKSGNVKDHYAPSVYGIATIGKGSYVSGTSKKKTKHYQCWFDMIRRCYDPKNRVYDRYGGRGVTVCKEWRNFQNFAHWYDSNHIEGFKLDKDLKNVGSMEYSPENCEFIPVEVNNLLISSNRCRGDWPVGISKTNDKYGYFKAECWDGNKRKHNLGIFKNPDDAFSAYKRFKESVIKEVAEREFNRGNISEAIYKNLINWQVVPYPE